MTNYKIKQALQDKKLRVKKLIYLVIALGLFISVLYDSYNYDIPFYYILAFYIGVLLGYLERYTFNIKWDQHNKLFVEIQNNMDIVIFIMLLMFRIFVVPYLVDKTTHPIHLYDVTALITIGVFYKKVKMYRQNINDMILRYVIENEDKA